MQISNRNNNWRKNIVTNTVTFRIKLNTSNKG